MDRYGLVQISTDRFGSIWIDIYKYGLLWISSDRSGSISIDPDGYISVRIGMDW